jgi:hypothetical protein
MNRERGQHRNEHPPVELLLLHLDGELEERDADSVRAHVGQCAACRAHCEQLERGISRFSAFQNSVIIPTPAPRTKALRERLLAAQAESAPIPFATRLQALFRLDTPPKVGFALGCASFCLIVWLTIFLTTPRQSVYASQLLEEARGASDSLVAQSKVLNQKIRLRRGNLVIERDVHHGRQTALQAQDSHIDAHFQQELERAHINLGDPLNANDFAAWRAGQREHTDSVKETPQSVTITTRISGDAITEGSLTLSRSNWRPIARSVELRGETPIEINEVSFDIRDSAALLPESAMASPLPDAATPLNTSATAVRVSAIELEIAELDLREALHAMGADVSAAPQIWRSEQTVFFHAFPRSPMQMHAIEDAASRIPHVKEGGEPAGHISAMRATSQIAVSLAASSPLANVLAERFGSAQAADSFLESLRNRSSLAMDEADALDQLGKRYTVDAMKTLPPDSQARVNNLAASLLTSLQRDSASYLKSLSPILDDAAKERNIAQGSEGARNEPGCLHWQQNAALAAPQLRDLDKNVSLLVSEKPESLNVVQLISDSQKARSFLELHLTSTCQLFSSN